MSRKQIPLDQLPLARTKAAETAVDVRNVDPKELPRHFTHRKGSRRVSASEWPREPGLGGWSETETSCLLGLDDYSRLFEFTLAAGSTDGFTVTFEFRPGAMSYEAGKDTDVVLWRWGGKASEPYVAGVWSVLASSGTPSIAIRFLFAGAGTTQEMVWAPALPEEDTVWYVAMTLAAGATGGASIRKGDGRGSGITTIANDPPYVGSIANLATTFNADFLVESDDKHSDLTLLGARSRAEASSENDMNNEAKGARPILSNFVVYSKALSDVELRDVLGQEV